MRNNKKSWVPFKFESNQSFGMCNTRDDWLKVKAAYLEYWKDHGGGIDTSKAMNNSFYSKEDIVRGKCRADFGFRCEHIGGTYSLAQFAVDNQMDL